MDNLVEIFCDVDDFCGIFLPEWEKNTFERLTVVSGGRKSGVYFCVSKNCDTFEEPLDVFKVIRMWIRYGLRSSRDTGCPVPPAQFPACGFSAPGSSVMFTRVVGAMHPDIRTSRKILFLV